MIKISALSHSLGGYEVLKDLNLTVNDGTIMGIVGINGAGKSTLLNIIQRIFRKII